MDYFEKYQFEAGLNEILHNDIFNLKKQIEKMAITQLNVTEQNEAILIKLKKIAAINDLPDMVKPESINFGLALLGELIDKMDNVEFQKITKHYKIS